MPYEPPKVKESSAGVIAVALAGAAGAGLLAWALLASKEREAVPTAKPDGLPAGTPAPSPAVPADTSPPTSIEAAFTKASIALAGMPDPYNPQLDEFGIYVNQHSKIDPNSAAGSIYNGIRSLIGAVPIVGAIVNIGMSLFEFIGPLVVGDSSGGWRDIPILSRQRIVLYQLSPSFYATKRPYKSQQIDLSAPLDKPVRSVGFGLAVPEEEYRRQYRAWLRRYLQTRTYEAEVFRVVRTLDEAMLPAVVMEFLYREGAWPPPLEPVPPRLSDFRARYQYTQNPAQYFSFDDSVIDQDDPVTKETYEELRFEYAEDARAFAARIAKVKMPADLAWLAVNAGCVPRWGSQANPKVVSSRRGAFL